MTRAELARWLAAIKPAPARVVAVRDGKEEALSIRRGPHQWVRAANTAYSLGATEIRVYDAAGGLVDRCDLTAEDDSPSPATEIATSIEGRTFSAQDVSAILAQAQVRTVEATANAVVRAVERTALVQSQAHAEAFRQLADMNRACISQLKELQAEVRESLAREREEIEAHREERETSQIEGVVWKLLERVGPEQIKTLAGVMSAANGAKNGQ